MNVWVGALFTACCAYIVWDSRKSSTPTERHLNGQSAATAILLALGYWALAFAGVFASACAKPVRTHYTPPYQVEPAAAMPSRWCEGADDTCCWRCVKKPEYRVGCDVAGLVPCPEGSR